MALPQSPDSLSFSQINVELGLPATAQISMNDSAVRSLFGVPSGQISMSNGRGKANKFVVTISSDQVDLDLRAWLVSQGWDQSVAVEVTNNASIYASSTGTYGMYITGSFPSGLTFTNNGNIIGRGGNGDGGRTYMAADTNCVVVNYITLATAGGPALYVSTSCTIYNNSIIGGGGGGGGSGEAAYMFAPPNACAPPPSLAYSSGGAGGGGAGFGSGGAFNRWNGSQATPGSLTGFCTGAGNKYASYNGPNGSLLSAGGGGSPGPAATNPCGTYGPGYAGAAGGGLGASGSNGTGYYAPSSSDARYAGYGAGGGAAVVGNGYITWGATGSRYGAIS